MITLHLGGKPLSKARPVKKLADVLLDLVIRFARPMALKGLVEYFYIRLRHGLLLQ
jgi:hypothetical protein